MDSNDNGIKIFRIALDSVSLSVQHISMPRIWGNDDDGDADGTAQPEVANLLLEDGANLLLEDGGQILLE